MIGARVRCDRHNSWGPGQLLRDGLRHVIMSRVRCALREVFVGSMGTLTRSGGMFFIITLEGGGGVQL